MLGTELVLLQIKNWMLQTFTQLRDLPQQLKLNLNYFKKKLRKIMTFVLSLGYCLYNRKHLVCLNRVYSLNTK